MAETNKNQWVNNFANAIGANNPTTPSGENASGSSENVDKYAALETTSYKDMLSSKIQASNAKEAAQKYSANVLNANGLGSQGIAESARTGIVNNYGKAIAAADETHNQNLLNIETQRQEDLANSKEADWQATMTMMQQAQSQADLDYIKENYYEGMDDKQKKIFDYYYASYSGSFGATQYNTLDALSKATYENNDGNISTLGENFNLESQVLWHHSSKGDFKSGDVISLANDRGEKVYMKWIGNGFVTVDESDYKKASRAFDIYRKDGKTYYSSKQ